MRDSEVVGVEDGRSGPGRLGEGYAVRLYPLDDRDEVGLSDLWRTLWARRWLVGGIALATGILAALLSFLITPVYRASVLAAPTAETVSGGLASLAAQLPGVAALAGLNLSGDTRAAEAVATLSSRAFTESFIRTQGLLPILFADRWNAEASRWLDDEAPTQWQAYELFSDIRSVEEDVETGLYTIEVTWQDPALAADWANAMIADVNRDLRTRAIEESRRNLEYLRGELEKSSQVPLQATIFSLIESEMKNAMLANVRQEYAFRVIDPATAPEKRSWPNRTLLALLGAFAGFVVGTFLVFARSVQPARA
jgi:uncharacterized protein involved in exopolysaccharide biosynthesis